LIGISFIGLEPLRFAAKKAPESAIILWPDTWTGQIKNSKKSTLTRILPQITQLYASSKALSVKLLRSDHIQKPKQRQIRHQI